MSKPTRGKRTVIVVTGSRAEYGLLRSVMRAIAAHPKLALRTIVAGSHLLPVAGYPRGTIADVRADFVVDATVRMQRASEPRTRARDALACGRGVSGFAEAFAKLAPSGPGDTHPAWVVVLGDRVEAFAAAAAASIAGLAVCHIHGGDRAEGVADEAMRHAITKLAHLHCCATAESAKRVKGLGEPAGAVIVTGSPAIDDLADAAAQSDDVDLQAIILLHPAGLAESQERAWAKAVLAGAERALPKGSSVGIGQTNFDAGREAIVSVLEGPTRHCQAIELGHVPRARFLALLGGLKRRGGVLIGNSSAGLIEAAALGLAVVNVGPRQAGRQRAGNVIDVSTPTAAAVAKAILAAQQSAKRLRPSTVYGNGTAGRQIAALLATHTAELRKRNAY